MVVGLRANTAVTCYNGRVTKSRGGGEGYHERFRQGG